MDTAELFRWILDNLDYWVVTFFMIIESSFIPFPSEVVVPPAAWKAMADGSMNIVLVVVFATIGANIGALINYYLARWLGRPIVYRFANSRIGHMCLLDEEKVRRAEEYFNHHGAASTFFGRLIPGIRQLISLPAGLARMKMGPFLLYTTLGAGCWNIVLALIGYFIYLWTPLKTTQDVYELATKYSHEIGYVILGLAIFVVAFLIYRARRGGPRIVARFSLRGLDPVLLLWGVLFVFATSLVIEPLLELLPAVPNVYGRGVWSLLTLVVMAPLFEEVIFRGVLLESARARYGVVAGWLISSLIFGVVHIYPAVMVNAIIMGLILGFVYIRTASLWPAIILHAFNNGVAYLMLAMGRENQMLSDMIGNRTVYALLYTLALLVFLVSGFMVCRTLSMLSREEKEERAEKKRNAA